MAAAENYDLTAAVAEATKPLQRDSMPPADLRLRLATSTALRRLLPTGLVVRRSVAKGRARWEDPHERRHALDTMSAILAGTARAGEVEELARRRLIEETVQEAIFWQPWRAASLDEASLSNQRRALSANRRLLLSACHFGPYFLNMSSFASLGCSTIAVSAPWFFRDPTPDYWGRRLARWRRGLARRNQRLATTDGGFALAQALLERGEVVLNYFDMPGSKRTHFLGKPVMLTGGSSQLAFQTEALVLPLRARRDGDRVWTDVFDPLDPRDYASAEELHLALAAVHERAILELPRDVGGPQPPGRVGANGHRARVGTTEPGRTGAAAGARREVNGRRRPLSAGPVLQRGQPRDSRDGAGAARAGAAGRAPVRA